jgi:CHAT domain-containing protein
MTNRINDEQSFTNFWAPIDNELAGKKKIFVSVDGIYNQISLNTLKKPSGDYLINKYDFVLLGNGKDLVNTQSKSAAIKKATLLGDPDYGTSKNVPPLPATKTEVDGITKTLKSSGYQVAELIQEDANEANLKAAKEVSILHIATHGFFFLMWTKQAGP